MELTNEELESLKNASTENEWNDICNKIKSVRNGQYPPDWYVKVIMSGLAGTKKFGRLKITIR